MEDRKTWARAALYMMPAVQDYLATRCLLLSNIFPGLTMAHEAIEKEIKTLLIMEGVSFPKSCHILPKLGILLIGSNRKNINF